MPYIKPQDRTTPIEEGLMAREDIGVAMGNGMRNCGDLQYMIAVAIQTYLENTGLQYAHCEDIMGALSGAKAEFIRCIVNPYEQEKLEQNGGVYDSTKMIDQYPDGTIGW